jgi:hypothetical protein
MVRSCIKGPAPYVPSCFFQACAVGTMHQSYRRFRLSLYVLLSVNSSYLLLCIFSAKRDSGKCGYLMLNTGTGTELDNLLLGRRSHSFKGTVQRKNL